MSVANVKDKLFKRLVGLCLKSVTFGSTQYYCNNMSIPFKGYFVSDSKIRVLLKLY